MCSMIKKNSIVMVGPGMNGLGGISRVVQLWRQSAIFRDNNIKYVESVNVSGTCKHLFLLRQLFLFIKSIMFRRCIVYIHVSSNMSFWRKSFFILLSKMYRKKIVLHIHPTHFFSFIKDARYFKKWLVYFILNRVNYFIVLSEDMKQKMQAELKNDIVSVLRNPVNIRAMSVGLDKYQRADNVLLYLGWYIQEKGIFDLVDAAEILIKNNIPIKIVFYGTKNSATLKSYVKRKKLNHTITINGWIGGEDKLRALHTCTALVLPSHSEGIPNVILEAMATHTPIIATPVGGLAEILTDGENAFVVKPKDPIDLSKVIRLCLADKEKRKALSERAYKEAMEFYDIGIIENQFKKILDAVIKNENTRKRTL